MRKPAFSICENKGADKLHNNCAADQRLYFRYTSSSQILNFKPLAFYCGCTFRFVSDLVGNPEDRFSHDAGHIAYQYSVETGLIRLNRCYENIKFNNVTVFQRNH